MPNASRTREATRVASSEWPPRSKKFSFTLTAWPKISLQIPVSTSSA